MHQKSQRAYRCTRSDQPRVWCMQMVSDLQFLSPKSMEFLICDLCYEWHYSKMLVVQRTANRMAIASEWAAFEATEPPDVFEIKIQNTNNNNLKEKIKKKYRQTIASPTSDTAEESNQPNQS